MKCLEIDLNQVLKVVLLGKESLIPPRLHESRRLNEYVMYVMIGGNLHLRVNGEEFRMTTGDVGLFCPGEIQEPVECSFCEYFYVHFLSDQIRETELNEEEYPERIYRKQKQCLQADSFSPQCYDFLRVLLRQKNHLPPGSLRNGICERLQNSVLTPDCRLPEKRLAISYTLASVLVDLENSIPKESPGHVRKVGKSYDTAREIASYIETHYAEPLSGEEIERQFFLTFDHANRVFDRIMGCSIIKYRNIVRIQHAKSKLRATNLSVQEIAAECGFENVHYFSRVFKKIEGLSPSHYKRKFLKLSRSECGEDTSPEPEKRVEDANTTEEENAK